jgi:hypothetical protein
MAHRDYSAPSQLEAKRVELGFDRLFLRPPAPCADVLDGLKRKLRTDRSLAAAYAIHRLAQELEGMSAKELEAAVLEAHALRGLK